MVRVRFRHHYDLVGGLGVADMRYRYIQDFRAQFRQGFQPTLGGGDYLRINPRSFLVEILPRDAYRQSAHPVPQGGQVIRHRHVGGSGILGIVAGDGLQHNGAVRHRPGHGAAVILGPGQRHYAVVANPPEGGLDAGNAAQRRRAPDAAAGVRAQGAHTQAGRHRRAGTAAAAAGHMFRIPGVARRREQAGEVRAAQGELVHRQLAQQDGAGRVQFGHGGGVLCRYPVGRYPGHCGGSDAGGVVQIFQRNGDAVHGPAILAGGDFRCRLPRLRQRPFRRERDIGIQAPVHGGDPVQIGLGQRHRRQLAGGDQRRRFANGQIVQFVSDRHNGIPPVGLDLARLFLPGAGYCRQSAAKVTAGAARGRLASCRASTRCRRY